MTHPADPRPEQSERMREAVNRKSQEARMRSEEESRIASERPPGVPDPRAKSTGHKKKTADKWNQ